MDTDEIRCPRDFGDPDMMALARSLSSHQKLRKFVAYGARVGDEGAIAFAAGLVQCKNLEELHLGGNHIGDTGATVLAQILVHCPKLATLSLGGNYIGDEGVLALAKALRHARNFVALDLSHNSIRDIEELCRFLPSCPKLAALDLSYNFFGYDAGGALRRAIPRCRELVRVDLCQDFEGLGDIQKQLDRTVARRNMLVLLQATTGESGRFVQQDGDLAMLKNVRAWLQF